MEKEITQSLIFNGAEAITDLGTDSWVKHRCLQRKGEDERLYRIILSIVNKIVKNLN